MSGEHAKLKGAPEPNPLQHLDVEECWIGDGICLEYLSWQTELLSPPTLDLLVRVHLAPLAEALARRAQPSADVLHLRVERPDQLSFAARMGPLSFAANLGVEISAEGDLTLSVVDVCCPGPTPVEGPVPALTPLDWLLGALPAGLYHRTGVASATISLAHLQEELLSRARIHLPAAVENWSAELAFYRNTLTLRIASVTLDVSAEGGSSVAEPAGEGQSGPDLPHIDELLLARRFDEVPGLLDATRLRSLSRGVLQRGIWHAEVASEVEGLPQVRRLVSEPAVAVDALCALIRDQLRQGETLRVSLFLRRLWELCGREFSGTLLQWSAGYALLSNLQGVGHPEARNVSRVLEQFEQMLVEEIPALPTAAYSPLSPRMAPASPPPRHLPGFDAVVAVLRDPPREDALLPPVVTPWAPLTSQEHSGALRELWEELRRDLSQAEDPPQLIEALPYEDDDTSWASPEELGSELALARGEATLSGDWRRHLNRVEQLLGEMPPDHEKVLRRELVESFRQMGSLPKATPHLLALLSRDPSDGEAEDTLRRLYQQQGQVGARIKLDAWLVRRRLSPQEAYPRLMNLASEAAALGLLESEMSCLRDVCEVDPSRLSPFLRLDTLLRGRGDWEELARLWGLRESLPAPAGVDAGLRVAEGYREGGDLPAARRTLMELLARVPGQAEVVRALAGILTRMGDGEGARELLDRESRGDSIEAKILRGEELLAGGMWAGAEQVFRAVLELVPSEPRAIRGLCRVWVVKGTPSSAVDLLRQVIERSPAPHTREEWQRELGDLFLVHLGDADRARVCYEDAAAASAYGIG